MDLARFDRLTNYVAGHHFGQAGRIATGVGVLLGQDFTRVVVDQHIGFGVDIRHARDHRFEVDVISKCYVAERKGDQ